MKQYLISVLAQIPKATFFFFFKHSLEEIFHFSDKEELGGISKERKDWRLKHSHIINYASPTCKSKKQFWLSQLALNASELVLHAFENTLLNRQACLQNTFAAIIHLPLHWMNSFEVTWNLYLVALGNRIKPENLPICFGFTLLFLLQAQNHSAFVVAVKCHGVPQVSYCEGKQNSGVAATVSFKKAKTASLTCVNH